MNRLLLLSLLLVPVLLSAGLRANDTFRVNQQVLVRGDPASHAVELLGTPVFKYPLENKFGAYVGESWQFKQETGRIVTVTIVAGKVADIEESQQY